MTLEILVNLGTKRLEEKGIQDAKIDAMYLLEYVLHISKFQYLMEKNREVTKEQQDAYLSAINMRSTRVPLQHITGEQEFMGFTFRVNQHVLIPRQDTEILVEEVAKLGKGKRILDMCTGSGCIILSLEQLCEPQMTVGVDFSKDALLVAIENGKTFHSNTKWIHSDLFTNVEGTFDIIVSNPPYIETKVIEGLEEEVRCHEPYMALNGGEDGLVFYRKIIEQSEQYLNKDGFLCFEIGYNQGEAVKQYMKDKGFTQCRIIKDLAGLDRVVIGKGR